MSRAHRTGYDGLAWFYEKYWGDFHASIFPAIQELALKRLKPGAALLDLCCGTGHLSRLLVDRGWKVTGTDLSVEMLKVAASAVPEAIFFASDARALASKGPFDAIISTFDSMNHLLDPAELTQAFRCVLEALSKGGIFLFDMLLEEAYVEDWSQTGFTIEPDNAFLLRGGYDSKTREARAEITMFRLQDKWTRSDVTILERYYPAAEFMRALSESGFTAVRYFDAKRDLRMDGRFSKGRAFISAQRGDS